MKDNDKIQGLKIPNKKVTKISQFADGTNFITINEESIIENKNFLTKYKKASGAIININETTITELSNAKNYNLQNNLVNFKIIKDKELFKILRIYFFKDLQFANIHIWNKCIQKIENQINLFSKRKLSLRGKAIILNSIVLSKAQLLSNLFPIPKQIEKKLHKLIFKYIWYYDNIEPISRKTYLPKEKGIGILCPNIHNIAMRIKHIMNLKDPGNLDTWTALTTYYISPKLYNLHNDFSHLKQNSIIKTEHPQVQFYFYLLLYTRE